MTIDLTAMEWGNILVLLGTVLAAFITGAWASHAKGKDALVQRDKYLLNGYNSLIERLREQVDRLGIEVVDLRCEIVALKAMVESQRKCIDKLLDKTAADRGVL